jgi:hypothetical protein
MSSFKVEMNDAAIMLRDSGPNSLVLVDELGKGTEPSSAACIAAAVLEDLSQKGCRGVFATHHHLILDMPLEAPGLRRMAMEVVEGEGGRLMPTWRVVEGDCRRSLALQVAKDVGLPKRVILRAQKLLQRLQSAQVKVGDVDASDKAPIGEEVSSEEYAEEFMRRDQMALEQVQCDLLAVVMNTCSSDANIGGELKLVLLEDLCVVLEKVVANFCKDQEADSKWEMMQLRVGMDASAWNGRSCLYIMRTSDGWAYCGETDTINSRIRDHRSESTHGHIKALVRKETRVSPAGLAAAARTRSLLWSTYLMGRARYDHH